MYWEEEGIMHWEWGGVMLNLEDDWDKDYLSVDELAHLDVYLEGYRDGFEEALEKYGITFPKW